MKSLREEIHKECEKPIQDRNRRIKYFTLNEDKNGINDLEHSIIDDFINIAVRVIERKIDEKINNINQEFKNEGYEGIDDIWMNLDVDDIVDYKELQSEKRALEEVKEMLK